MFNRLRLLLRIQTRIEVRMTLRQCCLLTRNKQPANLLFLWIQVMMRLYQSEQLFLLQQLLLLENQIMVMILFLKPSL